MTMIKKVDVDEGGEREKCSIGNYSDCTNQIRRNQFADKLNSETIKPTQCNRTDDDRVAIKDDYLIHSSPPCRDFQIPILSLATWEYVLYSIPRPRQRMIH